MLHVAAFVFTLLFLLTLYLFRGVISQLWKGTKKDIDKLETNLEKDNTDTNKENIND